LNITPGFKVRLSSASIGEHHHSNSWKKRVAKGRKGTREGYR
jgi:hypothetical protein